MKGPESCSEATKADGVDITVEGEHVIRIIMNDISHTFRKWGCKLLH